VFVTGFKTENIKAGKVKCKGDECDSTDLTIIGPAKPPAVDSTESAEERTKRLDAARRERVDDKNAEKAIEAEAEEDKLANVPLTQPERDFCDQVAAKMTPKDFRGDISARKNSLPPAADILRYSKLKKRYDLK
jgi:hypothetical protein